MSITTRLQRIRVQLDSRKAKAEAPPLIIRFVADISPNAPEGTERGEPDAFVMVPPGYHGPLPEGIPTFDEWSLSHSQENTGTATAESGSDVNRNGSLAASALLIENCDNHGFRLYSITRS